MKLKQMVYILWHDAQSEGPGWVASEDINTELAVCHSIGFIHIEDKEKITILQSYGESDVSQSLTIPKGWIIKIKKLRTSGDLK